MSSSFSEIGQNDFKLKDTEPDDFGEKDDFWQEYDDMADKYDSDMMARLNSNLDVLLIFAGLFSAINTAFIIVVMNGLSPNPADQTNILLLQLLVNNFNNTLSAADKTPQSQASITAARVDAVRQNCVFFASLCCSLLAAFGAVVAKQWLISYERTGQVGTTKDQVVRRAQKFAGAEAWGLRPIVETLPGLLLISLALFFAALTDYLWTIDKGVGLVLLGFSAAGALSYGFTVLAAAFYPTCPYQTSVSATLRQMYPNSKEFFKLIKKIYRLMRAEIYSPAAKSASNVLDTSLTAIPLKTPFLYLQSYTYWPVIFAILSSLGVGFGIMISAACIWFILVFCARFASFSISPITSAKDTEDTVRDRAYSQSVIWMAENSPERYTILRVARNIPFIHDVNALQLIAQGDVFRHLLSQLITTLRAVRRHQGGDSETDLIVIVRAVACIMLANRKEREDSIVRTVARKCVEAVKKWDEREDDHKIGSEELRLLLICIGRMCSDHGSGVHRRSVAGDPTSVTWHGMADDLFEMPFAAPPVTAATLYFRQSIFRARGRHHTELIRDIGAVLWQKCTDTDSSYLISASRVLLLALQGTGMVTHSDMAERSWISPSADTLATDLSSVLEEFDKQYRDVHKPMPLPTIRCYSRLLAQLNDYVPGLETLTQDAGEHTAALIKKRVSAINFALEHTVNLANQPARPNLEKEALLACRDGFASTLRSLFLVYLRPHPKRTTHPDPPGIKLPSEYRDPEGLDTTFSLAHRLDLLPEDKEKLLQGVLYRFLFHAHLPFYVWGDAAKHQLKGRLDILSDGRSIGPVLSSALSLIIYWMDSPAKPANDAEVWEAWNEFVREAVGGGNRAVAILQPSPPSPPEWPSLVTTTRRRALDQSEDMGPCLLWLASRTLTGEEKTIKLFVEITEKFKRLERFKEVHYPVRRLGDFGLEVLAAGVLFLKGWGASPTPRVNSPWTSPEAMRAFSSWIRIYEGHKTVPIMYEYAVFVEAKLDKDLVFQFIRHALEDNKKYAFRIKLEETWMRESVRLRDRDLLTSEEDDIEQWRP
ncbi:hypothetical protein FRB97_007343 [Tulasnella sp. 331]|nr:hypothetical protein FRB97_007343 [Tulasnella sp. 331]